MLADHGLSLSLNGQVVIIGALLAAFPADALSNPELAALLAFVELTQHSLETAAAYLALAERHASDILAERQRQFAVVLAIVRLGSPAGAVISSRRSARWVRCSNRSRRTR